MSVRVSNFVWRGDAWLPEVPVPAPLAELEGQFALHQELGDGRHLLARDPLGVNKCFWTLDGGRVVSANFLAELVERGAPLSRIWSVPAGQRLEIDPARRALACERVAKLEFGEDGAGASLEACADRIRSRLDAVFRRLRGALAGRACYVALSGGLDSSGVAALAREHLGPFTGVTFALEGTRDERGTDLWAARRVASELGVRLEEVPVSADTILEALDDVLRWGQDWRDFNVHCALVNDAVGRAIRSLAPRGARPVVLTGDAANELMADYEAEQVGDRTFYALPRMEPGRVRRYLVAGLDAGDREVGVFAAHGVDAIQPYALCADAYAALPERWLAESGAKQTLARAVLGDRIPAFVYERPKVRAQVGSERGGGVLGLLADRGIDQDALLGRFAALLGAEPAEVRRLIRTGLYRMATRYPEAA